MEIAGLLPSADAKSAALPIILESTQHMDPHSQAPYTVLILHS